MPLTNSPPTELTPAQLAESRAPYIHGVVTIVTVLGTVGVTLRCISRRMSGTRFSYDDYLIFVALLFLFALNTMIQVDVIWGFGRHLPAVVQDMPAFQKASLVILALYFTTSFLTKASLLALYFRLFSPSRRFRYAIYFASLVIIAQFVSVFFATLFQCVPVAAPPDPALHARCINLPAVAIATGVLNLATDVVILCLPLPMVWSLNTNRAHKVTLTGIFMLGTFVCLTSIVLITKLVQMDYSDPTWRLVDPIVWSIVEAGTGVFSACLPTLRPLFSQCIPLLPRTSRSNSAKNTGSGASSGSSRRAKRTNFAKLDEEAHQAGLPPRDQSHGSQDTPWSSPRLGTFDDAEDGYEMDSRLRGQGSLQRFDKRLPAEPAKVVVLR